MTMAMTMKTQACEDRTGNIVAVGIGDLKVSGSSKDVLVAYSIGSSVVLALYDPLAGVGGLVNCPLPAGLTDPARAAAKPGLFVDTGVKALVQELSGQGAQASRLVAKAAGGGAPLGREETFRIGERNCSALLAALADSGLSMAAQDMGGPLVRILRLHLADGRTVVKTGGQEAVL